MGQIIFEANNDRVLKRGDVGKTYMYRDVKRLKHPVYVTEPHIGLTVRQAYRRDERIIKLLHLSTTVGLSPKQRRELERLLPKL